MKPKVSVILPTYNRAHCLPSSCESVLNQSFRDLELIVVDDASWEDIEGVVRAISDDRVRYVRRAVNGGASAARNTGLAEARGDFIAFQDSDDLWLPGKLARQVAVFETLPNEVGVVTGLKILYGRDAERNYGPGKVALSPAPDAQMTLEEDQVRRMLFGNRISLQNALFRRACFPGDAWFDACAKANADWEFAVRLVQHTKVYEVVEPFVLAFISDDSISTRERKKIIGLLRILKKNRANLDKHGDIYAKHAIQLGRHMRNIGKRRLATRFVLSGLRRHPAAAFSLLRSPMRVVRRAFHRSSAPPEVAH